MSELPNPYGKTTIAWGKTHGQIGDLLRKYGCRSIRWTDLDIEDVPEKMNVDCGVLVLEFNAPNQMIEEKAKKPKKNKSTKASQPPIRDHGAVRMHQVRIMLPIPNEKMRNQLYRFLFYQLKNMLAAVQFGAFTFEQMFFSFMVIEGNLTAYQLAGGNEATGRIDILNPTKFKALPAGSGA